MLQTIVIFIFVMVYGLLASSNQLINNIAELTDWLNSHNVYQKCEHAILILLPHESFSVNKYVH